MRKLRRILLGASAFAVAAAAVTAAAQPGFINFGPNNPAPAHLANFINFGPNNPAPAHLANFINFGPIGSAAV